MTVGAGSTRAAAKMACRTAKPDGLLVLAPEIELAFLRDLRVETVWGIGPATAARLHDRGFRRLGDLAGYEVSELMAMFGKSTGRALHALAHNHEPPVRRRRGRRSVGAQSSIRRTGWSPELDDVLVRLAERVTGRMRRGGYAGRTLVLRLRFGDYETASRSRSLVQPESAPEPFLVLARALLAQARPQIERRAVTLLGLTVTNLGLPHAGEQLRLEVAA